MIYLNGTNDYLFTLSINDEIHYVYAKEEAYSNCLDSYMYFLITKEDYDKRCVSEDKKIYITEINANKLQHEKTILENEIIKLKKKVKDGKKYVTFFGVKCTIFEKSDSDKKIFYLAPVDYNGIKDRKVKGYFQYYSWTKEPYLVKVKEIICPVCDTIMYIPEERLHLDSFTFRCYDCNSRINIKKPIYD